MTSNNTALSQDPASMRAVVELSNLLNCGLDAEALKIIVELCEFGVPPESISKLIVNIQEERERKQKREKHQQQQQRV
jgi:hypothetical protein